MPSEISDQELEIRLNKYWETVKCEPDSYFGVRVSMTFLNLAPSEIATFETPNQLRWKKWDAKRRALGIKRKRYKKPSPE